MTKLPWKQPCDWLRCLLNPISALMTNFKSDLVRIIKQNFDNAGIAYDNAMDVCSLTASYLEMLNRRVVPIPRTVHFSEEIHNSLGSLIREGDMERQEKAKEAWRTVFCIRHLLTEGQSVNGFLSTGIEFATGERSRDELLWDFGLHHFHLSRKPYSGKKIEGKGFVERSDYLLFAIITQNHAYLVDVRPHQDPQKLGWVRQELRKIVYRNWPELIESHILRGVQGDMLTDEKLKELRRKNVNHCPKLGDRAVAPLGGGTMADGSSALCKVMAMRLLHEIERHQFYFDTKPPDLLSALKDKGLDIAGEIEFELVLLDELNPPAERVDSLKDNHCLSKDLYCFGLAVMERTTRLPIAICCRE